MADRARPAPLVALVARWAMREARYGRPVPGEVVFLLVVVAERFNHRRGYAFPGTETMCEDLGIGPRGLRKLLRTAEKLGAIVVKEGRGRGRNSEIAFTDSVWTAPNLDTFAFMDQKKRPQRRNGGSAFGSEKRGTDEPEKGNGSDSNRGTSVPPYRCATAFLPRDGDGTRPAVGSLSPTNEQTSGNGDGNGALTKEPMVTPMSELSAEDVSARTPDPLPSRLDQIRRGFRGSGTYIPPSDDEQASRLALLKEQAAAITQETWK